MKVFIKACDIQIGIEKLDDLYILNDQEVMILDL